MMKEQAFAQALLLTGDLEQKQRELLRLLCNAAVASLQLRLKDGLKAEKYGQDLICAASLYAVAALGAAAEETVLEEFKAGDLTVRQSGGGKAAAAAALEKQADLLIRPYLADGFTFVGV